MSDQGPVVQRELLVGELQRLRKAKALTQGDVASSLEWSQAKLMRIEGGRQSITRTDLEALLRLYKVEDAEEIQRLVELSRGARRTPWWARYNNTGIDPDFLRLVGFEYGCSEIRQSHNAVIPGLLQLRDYAEAVTSFVVPDPGKVSDFVDLRLERQRRLWEREKPPKQTFVLDEALIRRHIGVSTDPEIMPAQLRHLLTMGERAEVTIHVVPFSKGAHQGLEGPFMLFSFSDALEDILFRENVRASNAEFGDVVDEYNIRFEELLQETLTEQESLDMIRSAAEQMEQSS
jgi:transcriptional regulator with XRE-family HTH domain